MLIIIQFSILYYEICQHRHNYGNTQVNFGPLGV